MNLITSDTDSIILKLTSKDSLYTDFLKLNHYFDFSKYPLTHPLKISNKNYANQLDLLKNELNDTQQIVEIIGLKSKSYCFRTENSYRAVCKGFSRNFSKNLNFHNYKETLFNNGII